MLLTRAARGRSDGGSLVCGSACRCDTGGDRNPNSGIDAITLRDGGHLIVYNHTQRGRSPLNVAVSRDGSDWKPVLVLENQPGEYSCPAVIQAADGLVHVTYTWQRKRIRHVVIDPVKLAVDSPHVIE
ncbi:MAG TPA: exo-alpha-sialidase [Pirellulales bacterium]|nr:exo-alpha-sialidase [Pirellulales bacterium]